MRFKYELNRSRSVTTMRCSLCKEKNIDRRFFPNEKSTRTVDSCSDNHPDVGETLHRVIQFEKSPSVSLAASCSRSSRSTHLDWILLSTNRKEALSLAHDPNPYAMFFLELSKKGCRINSEKNYIMNYSPKIPHTEQPICQPPLFEMQNHSLAVPHQRMACAAILSTSAKLLISLFLVNGLTKLSEKLVENDERDELCLDPPKRARGSTRRRHFGRNTRCFRRFLRYFAIFEGKG